MSGERAANPLADRFHSIDALMDATTEQLLEVGDVGPKVAEAITFYFSVPANRERIEKMKRLGVQPQFVQAATGSALAGKTGVRTRTPTPFSPGQIPRIISPQARKT